MTRMLGRQVWYGVFCRCCNGPRSVQVEKRREERTWRSALRPEGELPTPLDDPTACLHACNGECLTDGSESCSFACHPDGPVSEAEYWAARAEIAAEMWPWRAA